MPELPEVETVRRSLEPLVQGHSISEAEVYYGKIIKYPSVQAFLQQLKAQKIKGIRRRGKYLIFELSHEQLLIFHLRMTGRITAVKRETEVAKHTHLVIRLSNGLDLRFADIRKFGTVYLLNCGEECKVNGLFTLGPEPLGEEFSLSYLKEQIKGKKTAIKSFLLNQTKIAGIGNIYADEILFAARLNPGRKLDTLNDNEIEALHLAVRKKLLEGIKYRGTSFKDYVDGLGEKGEYQKRLQVYGRAGERCSRCGAALEKKVVAGRGTVYCPHCQS